MINSGTQTVGTTRVAIDGVAAQPTRIKIRNNDSTKTLYIGGSDVTTANGFPIDKLATLDFDLSAGEQFYMISSDAGHSVSWVKVGL
jgi:hypothetical protein